jgi:hypothetical protein
MERHRRRRCTLQNDMPVPIQNPLNPDIDNAQLVMEVADLRSQLSAVVACISGFFPAVENIGRADVSSGYFPNE